MLASHPDRPGSVEDRPLRLAETIHILKHLMNNE